MFIVFFRYSNTHVIVGHVWTVCLTVFSCLGDCLHILRQQKWAASLGSQMNGRPHPLIGMGLGRSQCITTKSPSPKRTVGLGLGSLANMAKQSGDHYY